MKKIFKSRLFLIILTVIITTSIIGVSASILYQANEIGFTPQNPNWKVNNLESALNDLYSNSKISKTLLWENSNTNTSFKNQTITLSSSMSNYTHFLLRYKANKDNNVIYEDIFKISPYRELSLSSDKLGNYTYGATSGAQSGQHWARHIFYNDETSLIFGTAFVCGDGMSNNNYMIPVDIYGLNLSID